MLDKERLDELLAYYVSKFPGVANTPLHHEMLKWRAVAYCKKRFDIEEVDFGAMLKDAFSVWRSLIDYGGVTPLTAIVKLCEKGYGEDVRRAFRDLLKDDGAEPLDERWNRIIAFRDRINELREEAKLGGWRYKCDHRCVMMILGFLRPETDYMFKSMPAVDFALYTHFNKYIGAGKKFRLDNYYLLCEELIDELHKRSAILDMIHKGIQQEAAESGYEPVLSVDTKDHIAVYDVIYVTATYGFFEQEDVKKKIKEYREKIISGKKTGKTKTKRENAIAAEEARRQMQEMLERDLQTSLDMVAEQESLIDEIGIPAVTGMEIDHLKYGKGTIVTQNDRTISVQFTDILRKMDLFNLFAAGSVKDTPEDLQMACIQLKEYYDDMKMWQRRADALKRRIPLFDSAN